MRYKAAARVVFATAFGTSIGAVVLQDTRCWCVTNQYQNDFNHDVPGRRYSCRTQGRSSRQLLELVQDVRCVEREIGKIFNIDGVTT